MGGYATKASRLNLVVTVGWLARYRIKIGNKSSDAWIHVGLFECDSHDSEAYCSKMADQSDSTE